MRQTLGAHEDYFQDLLIVAHAPGQTKMLLKDFGAGLVGGVNVPTIRNTLRVVGDLIQIYFWHFLLLS